jgi:WD40 repeat protein
MRYTHPEEDCVFYSLSWSRLGSRRVLAAGSHQGEVRLFHPARHLCFASWAADGRRGSAVHAVEFHSGVAGWLLVATADSQLSLWDLGDPEPPAYGRLGTRPPVQLLKLVADSSPDLYSLAWVDHTSWLLAGTAEGLLGWRLQEEAPPGRAVAGPMIHFELMAASEEYGESVDSVASLGQGLVAAKCVAYGKILVFRAAFPGLEERGRCGNLCRVEVLLELAWRLTTNFYMSATGDVGRWPHCAALDRPPPGLGMLVCGDDRGTVWLYRLPDWLERGGARPVTLPARLLPVGKLPWPALENEEKRVEIMVDKVVLSPSGRHLVAVTNNNIVAFWERSRGDMV